MLTGGAGADTFGHEGKLADLAGQGGDTIKDFSSQQGDRLEFGFGDGKPTFVGTNAFTGLDRVHYVVKGGNTYVEANTTGDTHADFTVELAGVHQLHASDFIV